MRGILKLCLMCFLVLWGASSAASQHAASGKLIEYLAAEKVNLTVTNSEARSRLSSITEANFNAKKEGVTRQLVLTLAKIGTLNDFLVSQEKRNDELKARLKQLKQSSSRPEEVLLLQDSVNQMNVLIHVNEKAIELILDNLELAHQYEKLLNKQEQELIIWEAKRQKQRQLQEKQDQIRLIDAKRALIYDKNIDLEQQKKTISGHDAESDQLLNNQAILLLDHKITILSWEVELIEADYLFLEQGEDMKALELLMSVYQRTQIQFVAMRALLSNMLEWTKQDHVTLFNTAQHELLEQLRKNIDSSLVELTQLQATSKQTIEDKQLMLKEQRASHQQFKAYREESWSGISKQLAQIPVQFYHYLEALVFKMIDYYLWEDAWPQVLFWSVLLGILLFGFGLRYMLRPVTQEKARSRFSGHLLDGALLLFYRNILQFSAAGCVMAALALNQVPMLQASLLFHILLVWLLYRQLIGLARLVLLERVTEVSDSHEMILYHRLKWLFLLGAWSSGLMVLSHELPLAFLLQDIFNRFFMLFLLGVSVVLWKSRDAFPHIFHPWFRTNKPPIRHLGALLSMLIPFTLFTTAVIGLLGYVNFASLLSRYQAYFLLILTAYVLLRELLADMLDLLSEWMVSRLNNGWLWIEAILKPLEKWLHVGLAVLGIFVFFEGVNQHWDQNLPSLINKVGHYPIIRGSGIEVTLFSSIEAIILLMVLIWLSRWTRELCYRWLYRRVLDAAIRNSFSVFTQYAVILLGTFVLLRVLGLDLTGMGMILGGLAVGMGFGLRDFASNIVGGLMLLIERPVREGDLITLGEYEGRVAHIGIRSMRILSWDHMDVLIPNAETFNKPVTNWTHQDGVVRTVLPIKVSRSDDPVLVQQLILDVLEIIPEVLSTPESQVYLKQIDEALLEFDVRYFINIQLNTRFLIRSKVLFAIMAQFKAAGIEAPIPPMRVELTADPSGHDETEADAKQ
ncbi:MAG: mechanosensitive ion channel [Legionellaceae bacterium]|nr:mechanosensitive ion channel [Legionellaceae bacterium]